MNCRSVREQLWADRGEAAQDLLAAHLGACSSCTEAAAEVKRLRSWLHELPVEEPSAQFDWRLRLRLARASKSEPATRSRWASRAPMQFAASMAAAAVVVLAVGLIWTRDRGPESAGGSGPLSVTTPGTLHAPVTAPSVVQVRGRSGLPDIDEALRSEGRTARNDSDSTIVVPRR